MATGLPNFQGQLKYQHQVVYLQVHAEQICTSLSSKKLKLNLEHQITANDTNREEDLIDNTDPSSSSSEDNDIDHEEDRQLSHTFL